MVSSDLSKPARIPEVVAAAAAKAPASHENALPSVATSSPAPAPVMAKDVEPPKSSVAVTKPSHLVGNSPAPRTVSSPDLASTQQQNVLLQFTMIGAFFAAAYFSKK
jgi:hypothetical protein